MAPATQGQAAAASLPATQTHTHTSAPPVGPSRTNPLQITTLSTCTDFDDDENNIADSIVYRLHPKLCPTREPTGITLDKVNLKIFKTLNNLYLDPWVHFLQQTDAQNKALLLKKVFTESMTTRATSDVATLLDTEQSADPEQLQDLIRKSVETKVTKVINKTTSKNYQGRAKSNPSVNNNKRSNDIYNCFTRMPTGTRHEKTPPKSQTDPGKSNKQTGAKQNQKQTDTPSGSPKKKTKKVTFDQSQGDPNNASKPASTKNKRKNKQRKQQSKHRPTGQLKKPPSYA